MIKMATEQRNWTIEFSGYNFLKRLNRLDAKNNYVWLSKLMDRLSSTMIRVQWIDNEEVLYNIFDDTLISKVFRSNKTHKYSCNISNSMVALLGCDNWSYINLERRLKLSKKQIAMAVDAFLATTNSPHWFTIEDINNLGGIINTNTVTEFYKNFKKRVLPDLIENNIINKFEVNPINKSIGLFWDK